MSQSELADGRFSKEYVSQVERGKARPTRETLEWLAGRLATDREYLEAGVSRSDAQRVDGALRNAELLVESHRYEDALVAFGESAQLVDAVATRAYSLRRLTGEAWARIRIGDLAGATSALEEAAALAASEECSDVDRANVLFLRGVCRYSASSITEATALFDDALTIAERSRLPCDGLRSDIFQWRSRCHRRERDWLAAREDAERALELAEALLDRRRAADAYFQASLVAQREGRWVLARTNAERSKALFEELGDRATVGRLLNNLAGINHLLGSPPRAIALLGEAFEIFVELGLDVEAGYVSSSLADIYVDSGDHEQAEVQARQALGLLAGRVDHLQEVGTAQLALGRALVAQGKLSEAEELIATADRIFERANSLSHRSDAWIARGDLATNRGEHSEAARQYRRAARALLDTHD
jgi:tetratricopeptide (TPR) repeat protein